MGAHDIAGNHQSQACAALPGRSLEGLEQAVTRHAGKAGTVIGSLDRNAGIKGFDHADRDLTRARLKGVPPQICKDPVDLVPVGFDNHITRHLVANLRAGAGSSIGTLFQNGKIGGHLIEKLAQPEA